jgi:uncharacterized protein YbjT (DUF2867 family)
MRIAVAGGTGLVGRYVVETASGGGHQVVVLARSHGIDVRTGHGLAAALAGAEAIVDVTNAGTRGGDAAAAFFGDVSARLQEVGSACGVRHLVTLSIIGIERAPGNGYYAAKLRQEQVARSGPVPATIVRAAQFHEFAVQMLRWTLRDGVAHVPRMRVQPVAARSVGEQLVELAVGVPRGLAPDLAGPVQAELADLSSAFVRRYGLPLEVEPAPPDPTVPTGATLPADGAHLVGPSFHTWLETDDAARLAAAWAAS